ncbi:MAG: hypothetical protein V7717_09560 [Porticoccaceae bacterium]
MKFTFRILAALLFSLSVGATTLPKISVAELFNEADMVAIVQVVDGQVLGELEESCGAKYKARVIRGFKGADTEYIYFGHFHGYEIGGRYLLFLTEPSRDYRPLMSTNSRSVEAEREFMEKCSNLLTAKKVMHSGNGALKIMWTGEYKYKDAVAVPNRYVAFPESVPRKPADLGERGEFSEYVWILETSATEYLESIAKTSAPNKAPQPTP